MTNALLQVSGYPGSAPAVPWIDIAAVVVGVVLMLEGSVIMAGLLYLRRNRDR